MVREQIEARGVRDPAVLMAMRRVPRERFVPDAQLAFAYEDRPLPLGPGATISQPYIVARMTEDAAVRPGDRVLEVGTGSGYQAAVLAALGAEVFTIERDPALAARAGEALDEWAPGAVRSRTGDGALGWPEVAPFDAIVVTAAPVEVPATLTDQLADGGRLVIPVGEPHGAQRLLVVTREGEALRRREVLAVRFVPLR